jgi:hypothetical protein
MLEAMVDCAHPLALRFGEAALAEPDVARALQLDAAFHRGFLAVRMGVRLCLTLRAAAKAAASPFVEREDPERERPEREDLDSRHRSERPEPVERDRDRDREYEPVSLQRFLASLRGLADDTRNLPVQASGEALPTLEALLARVAHGAAPPDSTSRSTAGVSLLMKPPPAGGRALLLGSASPPLALRAALRPRPPPRGSG